jgi:hypothetical protein
MNKLVALFLIFNGFVAWSQEDVQVTEFNIQSLGTKDAAVFRKTENFLSGLGFKNYTAQIQNTLDTKTNISAVSKAALEESIEFYEIFNASRKISALAYLYLKKSEKLNTTDRTQVFALIVKMAAQQSMPFPLLSLEPIHDKEYSNSYGKKALVIREKKLKLRAAERFKLEQDNLLKTFSKLNQMTNTLNSDDFQLFIAEQIYVVLENAYTATSTSQNRYLGRALIAVLIKYYRENHFQQGEEQLKKYLAFYKLDLDQIVNAKMELNSQIEDIKSGDIALEFSVGISAYAISAGVQPTNTENKKIAQKEKLISSFGTALFNLERGYKSTLQKQRLNGELTEQDQSVLESFWYSSNSKGYSHAGLVEVKTDKATGISLIWIWDCYPSGRLGYVRLSTPEGFAHAETHVRFGLARYSPQKVLLNFKQQINTRGYLENVWESPGSKLVADEAGDLSAQIDSSKKYFWPSKASKSEILNWNKNVTLNNSEDWYQKQMLKRVFKVVESYAFGEKAVVFSAGIVNAESMSYCSQMIKLAFLQGANFDIQDSEDQYRQLPKTINKLLPNAIPFDMSDKIIAPGGLVWQSKILEKHIQVILNRDYVKAQQNPQGETTASKYTRFLSDPTIDTIELLIQPLQIELQELNISDDDI